MNQVSPGTGITACVAEQNLLAWMDASTVEELHEGAIYLQRDASWLYAAAAKYRDTPGQEWIAVRVQVNAAHSAKMARFAAEKLRSIEVALPIEISQPGDSP